MLGSFATTCLGKNLDTTETVFWVLSALLTEIRIDTDKLGSFYFGRYILHLLFHKDISTKFASLSSSQKNTSSLVITTAAMLITVIKPSDYMINADW